MVVPGGQRPSNKVEMILKRLEERFPVRHRPTSKDAFKVAVRTILSQNTNDRLSSKAFGRLSERFQVEPKALRDASESEIAEAIKIGGLYRNKSKIIKRLSAEVASRYGGDLNRALGGSLETAREELLKLPGIGSKTADVILLFVGRCRIMPCDTHILRITKRLGLVPPEAGYEQIRRAWEQGMQRLPFEDFKSAHLRLIALGRSICTARRAHHEVCPISGLCEKRTI